MRRLSFVKMSGAGNDFVLVDAGRARGAPRGPALARRLCSRRRSIGADGLLLLRRGPALEYFNADGSRAFCANGTRCAAWWLSRRGAVRRLELATAAGPVEARITGRERVRLRMPLPAKPRWNLRLSVSGKVWTVHSMEVGVPHAVVETRGLDRFPVVELGRALRRHKAFGKAGANVNFVERVRGGLRLRTYERGVEDETLACGTGAVASAFWDFFLLGARGPIRIRTRGGESLDASFKLRGGLLEEAWLEGPARVTFEGEIEL